MKPGWQVRPLGEVCTVVNGGTPQSSVAAYWGGDVNWLTPKDMGQMDGRHIAETPRKITREGLDNCSARLVPAGSVIMSTRAPIGHLAINDAPMAFNQGCRGMVPGKDLDPLFLFHVLSANIDALNDLGTGTTFKELSASALKGFPIPLPPLDEQRRIVAVLDDAFEGLSRARANTEANLADARELFASQIEDLIMRSGGIEVSLEKLIEEGAILSHFDGNHGENYPRKEEFVAEGVPYLSANCIVGNDVDLTRAKFLPEERADTLRKGTSVDRDVLFAHNATVGPVALLRTDLPRVLLSTSLTHYRCNETALLPEFLLAEMQSSAFVRQYQAVMRQATRNQVPISAQRKLTHIIPPMEAQQRIAEISTQLKYEVDRLVGIVEQSAHDLDTLRQSLLQKAFSGELT